MARVSDFDRYLIGQGLGLLVVGVGAFVSPFLINGGVIGLMVLSREARSATGDAWLGIAMTAVSSALTGVVMTLVGAGMLLFGLGRRSARRSAKRAAQQQNLQRNGCEAEP
jgi:hypothetical protein